MAYQGTVLGFDFGQKRIGVSVGYFEVRMASPLQAIEQEDNLRRFKAIDALIQEWKPSVLVVGLAVHADGTAHEMTARCLRFGRQLAGRFSLPVEWVDERYTSIIAEELLRTSTEKRQNRHKKGNIDSLSAQIIVQTYLDSIPSKDDILKSENPDSVELK